MYIFPFIQAICYLLPVAVGTTISEMILRMH